MPTNTLCKKTSISITWTTEDVLSLRDDLTEGQASEVLWQIERDHDASQGINWSVIEICADQMFPRVEMEAA